MAGVACLEQILKHSPKFNVTVFGDETHANYNRILLSSVLAGERSADDIMINPLAWYQENQVALRLGVRITEVDSERRIIKGDDGSVTHYDKLLLATGSNAWMPPIEGIDKEKVEAKYHNGVLTVTLLKTEEGKAKRISVKAS